MRFRSINLAICVPSAVRRVLTPRGDTLSKELYGYHQSVIAGFTRECCNYDHVLSSGVELEGLANKVLAREYMTVLASERALAWEIEKAGKELKRRSK
jgi:hypothetical protein